MRYLILKSLKVISIYFLVTVSPPNHTLRHENTEYDRQLEKLLIVKKNSILHISATGNI